ncbi:MAG: arabinan endo-1,5-alpha-L-arabinosidase [Chitinophagaceae bacterium]
MKSWVTFFLLAAAMHAGAQRVEVGTVLPTRQAPVHDPVMIKQGDRYYLFCTGFGIAVWSSADMQSWKKEKPVFEQPPQWAVTAIPGYRGHTWAPDISYHNGQYCLYYSVSAFGKNTSCIGLATNPTLDPASPDFKWTDHGPVIQSVPGRDMWNAIDPNLAFDGNQLPWLVFGSFWNGIKLVKLAGDLQAVAKPEEWYTVAARQRSFGIPDTAAGDAAIEAPFIFRKGNYYYLFVSFDYCCRGMNSTYKMMVGRSETITGPYLDRQGVDMRNGGGTLLQDPDLKPGEKPQWYGVGHNAVYTFDGKDYIVYHGYDANDNGRSKLIIRALQWDDGGWPALIAE